MKSAEMFWNTILFYNNATILYQAIMFFVGFVLTIWLYMKPSQIAKVSMKIYLAFSFAWISIVFFILYDKSIMGHFIASPLFGIISILFIVDIFINKTKFEFNKSKTVKISVILFYLLYLTYPFVSFIIGHSFPRIVTLIMPCPLTVFTITLMVSSMPKIDKKVFALLLVWGITALPKIFKFQVPEDWILFISGIYGLVMLIDSFFRYKTKANRITT